MKSQLINTLILSLLISCSQAEEKKNEVVNLTKETPDKKILSEYLKKARISEIVRSPNLFEARIWNLFDYTKKFPSMLTTIQKISNKNSKITHYIFLTKNERRIESLADLSNLIVKKFEVINFEPEYVDTIINTYNLEALGKIDNDSTLNSKNNTYTTYSPKYFYFEQKGEKGCYTAFVAFLEKNAHSNTAVNKLSNYIDFVNTRILLNSDGFEEWVNPLLNNIYSLSGK